MQNTGSETKITVADVKSGTQTGHKTAVRLSKTSLDFWKTKVQPRIIRGEPTPLLYVRFRDAGRDAWICLDTSNKVAAAAKARDYWVKMKAIGLPALLAELAPDKKPDKPATVGEYVLAASALRSTWAGSRKELREISWQQYLRAFRRLVAGIKGMEAKGSVFYAKSEESTEWREKIDSTRLDQLTCEKVEKWRADYIAKAGHDLMKQSCASKTASSIIRNARALFSEKFTAKLQDSLVIPTPAPLQGIDIGKTVTPFSSKVSPHSLYATAVASLKGDTLLALLLMLGGGLRRKEADTLGWDQVDLDKGTIHIRLNAVYRPKSEQSWRFITLPPELTQVLKHKRNSSPFGAFVLDGEETVNQQNPTEYRAHCWGELIGWLKDHGITSHKPLHELRKMAVDYIAKSAGIQSAKVFAGHRDISTTSDSYADGAGSAVVLSPLQQTKKKHSTFSTKTAHQRTAL